MAMRMNRPLSLLGRRFSSETTKKSVGFIGLGNMGGHMAHNLLKSGHNVCVYDVMVPALELAESRGAAVASNPREVASQSDVLITMLPSSPHVREVYTGADGILQGVKPDTLCIDSSTIDPGTSVDMANAAKAAGVRMVDAPVSGGVGGAEHGTLTFMVGGSEPDFQDAEKFLQHMGSNIVHCGDHGTGQVAKVCNNLILAISMVGVSEGYSLAVKLGMDPKKLAGIVNTSSGRCWSSDTYNPCPGVMEGVPASREYDGGFGVDLMKKDLGLALDAAKQAGAAIPLGAASHQLYQMISSHGGGQKDFGYVYEFLKGMHNK